jgi:hypothetical protein
VKEAIGHIKIMIDKVAPTEARVLITDLTELERISAPIA